MPLLLRGEYCYIHCNFTVLKRFIATHGVLKTISSLQSFDLYFVEIDVKPDSKTTLFIFFLLGCYSSAYSQDDFLLQIKDIPVIHKWDHKTDYSETGKWTYDDGSENINFNTNYRTNFQYSYNRVTSFYLRDFERNELTIWIDT